MRILQATVTAALVAALLPGALPAEAAFPGANGKIAFTSDRDGNTEVYVMNADGSGQTNLTNHPGRDGSPRWSPDGTKIAFTSDRDGNTEVYVMNADGSGQTNLTNHPGGDGGPAWSPDGTEIAFSTNRDANGGEIYVMNADGSGQTNLTNNEVVDGESAWSPDGTKILFASLRDGNDEVYVMNADGSGQTNVTNHAAHELKPEWSPDGSRIAFRTDRDDDNEEVYVMNADGSGETNLSNHPGGDSFPAWSPNGTKIAFSTDRDNILGEGDLNLEVYVMNADGSGQTNLTDHPGLDSNPDWQPTTAADLAVVELDLAALDGAGLSDLLVGGLFEFDAPLTLRNLGDVAEAQPQPPVDARVSRTIEVPAGLSAFVRVTDDEAPATVAVDDGQGTVVAINQPTGTVAEIEGPGAITVGFDASALEAGVDRVLSSTFGVRCREPGVHEVDFSAEIFPTAATVVDPAPANDVLEVGRVIECVLPVQINIRPGNSHNFVNPNSNQSISVATLTTTAGEYGLPLDFDASTIDHPTARFGTLQTLEDGGGSTPSPNVPFIQDSFEMDDATKDGDLDLVLRFAGSGTDIAGGSTQACLVGTYLGDGASPLTFFGCDLVQVQS